MKFSRAEIIQQIIEKYFKGQFTAKIERTGPNEIYWFLTSTQTGKHGDRHYGPDEQDEAPIRNLLFRYTVINDCFVALGQHLGFGEATPENWTDEVANREMYNAIREPYFTPKELIHFSEYGPFLRFNVPGYPHKSGPLPLTMDA